MKISSAFFIFILLFLFANFTGYSANKIKKRSVKKFEQALEAYKSGDDIKAESLALRAIELDSMYAKPFLLLADIYDVQGREAQERWALEAILKKFPGRYPKTYRLLGDNYFESFSFEKALSAYRQYNKHRGGRLDSKTGKRMDFAEKSVELKEVWEQAKLHQLNSIINTASDEYWPFIAADDSTLYFTRLLRHPNNFSYERIFYSRINNNEWSNAKELILNDDELANIGTVSFTADERLMFFTKCGDADGLGSCDIFYFRKSDQEWSGPFNAGENVNTEFWDAQPSVSPLGNYLYWSSNRSGGKGARDIWFASVVQKEDGSIIFSEAQNLPKSINTESNDYSPFIHADGLTLYFSSNGHYGMGNADIFYTQYNDGEWSNALNLGYPLNSFGDDDGLVLSPTASTGLFSSNRRGATAASKDIYRIKLPQLYSPKPSGYVKGFVMNARSKEKLNAEISFHDLTLDKKYVIDARAQSGYIITLQKNHQYVFNISKPGFLFYSKRFDASKIDDWDEAVVENHFLEPIVAGERMVLNNIFFEFDSANLDQSSRAELNEVIRFMKMNPSLKIEISGHTDNVGDENYNQRLSEERATSVVRYLEKEIAPERMQAKGYGARRPVADNTTENGQAKNRRTELKILQY